MNDHMLRATCGGYRYSRTRPTTVKILYEVREVARIEPAPRLYSLHSSCCARCRCARLTNLLLLCDAQARYLPDEATRLQISTAEPVCVP